MFRIWFINFGWYSQNEGHNLEEAKKIARKAGFQCRIDDPNGEPIGTWCQIAGWRNW